MASRFIGLGPLAASLALMLAVPGVPAFAAPSHRATSPLHVSRVAQVQTLPPFQQTVSDAAYDIEARNAYCAGGGIDCTQGEDANRCFVFNEGCIGLYYADVEAYGLPNGNPAGTPAAMYVECRRATATGYEQALVSVYSAAGASTYGVMQSDQGTISGNASVLSWFQTNPTFTEDLDPETNIAQPSSISASAYDPHGGYLGHGTFASVTGVQNIDNSVDTWNAGEFRITMSGEIDTYGARGAYVSSRTGTITCYAGGQGSQDLANAGLDTSPYFEGELEWEYSPVPDLAIVAQCGPLGGNHQFACTFFVRNVGDVPVSGPFTITATLTSPDAINGYGAGRNSECGTGSSGGAAGLPGSSTATQSWSCVVGQPGAEPVLRPNEQTDVGTLYVNVSVNAKQSGQEVDASASVNAAPGETNLANNTFSGTFYTP